MRKYAFRLDSGNRLLRNSSNDRAYVVDLQSGMLVEAVFVAELPPTSRSHVDLDVVIERGKIEDLLKLAIKTDERRFCFPLEASRSRAVNDVHEQCTTDHTVYETPS
jgi:hypothetical protein